jgi:competence protein ComEA
MSMRSDHKALLFLATIAVLGAAVRVARAVSAPPVSSPAALEHQMQAADSAKRSAAAKRADRDRRKPAGATRRAAGVAGVAPTPTAPPFHAVHRDYRGRLDLDVATAAEIDSLPGMGPALAKRIVADRMANGAFRELVALRRVKGVSAKVLAALDSVVSFSGAYKAPVPSDTIFPKKSSRKRR